MSIPWRDGQIPRLAQTHCWCYFCDAPPEVEVRLRVPFPERRPVVKVCQEHRTIGIPIVKGGPS